MSLENVQEVLSVIANRHIQAVVVVLLSYIGAKIVEWGVVRVLSRLGR
jgi:hypothetical protein